MTLRNIDYKQEPKALPDLSYGELVIMIEKIMNVETDEEEQVFLIRAIDMTLPGADISDLLYWPDHWFNDENILQIELSEEEVAGYVLAWTGEALPGSEGIDLPEIPSTKKPGLPPVIAL